RTQGPLHCAWKTCLPAPSVTVTFGSPRNSPFAAAKTSLTGKVFQRGSSRLTLPMPAQAYLTPLASRMGSPPDCAAAGRAVASTKPAARVTLSRSIRTFDFPFVMLTSFSLRLRPRCHAPARLPPASGSVVPADRRAGRPCPLLHDPTVGRRQRDA